MKKINRLTVLGVLCALSLVGMVLALAFGSPQAEFTPPPFEPDAQTGVPEVPAELGYQALDVGSFRVLLCGVIVPDNGAADVWFTNPAENAVWLKLRVLDQNGNVLGQTGILRPGEYVEQVTLQEIPGAGMPVILKVMAYEPETYYAAGALTLNTVIAAE